MPKIKPFAITIQSIEDITKVCRKYNILFHTDAAQSIGKIPTIRHLYFPQCRFDVDSTYLRINKSLLEPVLQYKKCNYGGKTDKRRDEEDLLQIDGLADNPAEDAPEYP